MGIVRFALRFPHTFYVLAALILFLGVAAIRSMPTDIFPEIRIPVVTVIWSYTGLTTPEMEQRVSTYSQYSISANVNGIKNVEAQTATPVPTPSTVPSPVSTSMASSTATTTPSTTTMSPTAMMSSTPLGTIPTPIVGTTTGNTSPTTPLGNSSTTVCSSIPGGPPTNGAALPLSTLEIPPSPPPGTIQPAIAELVSTSIDPTTMVVPTPNTSACAESMTMNLATPGTMTPANATGAAATPGVSPASPPGC